MALPPSSNFAQTSCACTYAVVAVVAVVVAHAHAHALALGLALAIARALAAAAAAAADADAAVAIAGATVAAVAVVAVAVVEFAATVDAVAVAVAVAVVVALVPDSKLAVLGDAVAAGTVNHRAGMIAMSLAYSWSDHTIHCGCVVHKIAGGAMFLLGLELFDVVDVGFQLSEWIER